MRGRLHGLDAWRGVAALVVCFHHLIVVSGRGGIPLLPWLAVDLFFVISGYVMARTYEVKLRDGSLSPVGFVAVRYIRLAPTLAIGTALGLVYHLIRYGPFPTMWPAFGLALIFLPAPWLARAFVFNIPAWSLFLEIVSNAIHGSVLAKLSERRLAALMIGCALAVLVLLPFGLAQWDRNFLSILSCLPRELAFYLGGILVYRRFGDFDFVKGEWALWLGAISYPLYATHLAVIELVVWYHGSPALALSAALGFAWMLSVTVEKLRLRRLPSFRAMRPSFR